MPHIIGLCISPVSCATTQLKNMHHITDIASRRNGLYGLGFIVLYGLAQVIACSAAPSDCLSTLLFGLGVGVAIPLVLLLSRKHLSPLPALVIAGHPSAELRVALAWYAVYMALSVAAKGGGILASEVSKWLWFVAIPMGLLFVVACPKTSLVSVLRSTGFRRRGSGKAALLGLSAFLALAPLIALSLPASRTQELIALLQNPGRFLVVALISLVLSFFTAAFTEEVFFRGVIQSRIQSVFGSETQACVMTAVLFGIYHLPYAYFSPSWPTHGNMALAFSSVVTEQMVIGLLLGVLWARTRHIAASMVFHALINLPMFMTVLKFG